MCKGYKMGKGERKLEMGGEGAFLFTSPPLLVVLALAITVTTMMIISNWVRRDPDLTWRHLTYLSCSGTWPEVVDQHFRYNVLSSTASFVYHVQYLEPCLRLTSQVTRPTTPHWMILTPHVDAPQICRHKPSSVRRVWYKVRSSYCKDYCLEIFRSFLPGKLQSTLLATLYLGKYLYCI
jgi:hypothetical protein